MSRSRTMSVARMVAKKRTGSCRGGISSRNDRHWSWSVVGFSSASVMKLTPWCAVEPLDLVGQLRRVCGAAT